MGKYFDTLPDPKYFQILKSKGRYFKSRLGYGFILENVSEVIPDVSHSVFSISVPKKSIKLAVDRNRVKRLFRAALTDILRTQQIKAMGLAFIFKGTEVPKYDEVLSILENSILKKD